MILVAEIGDRTFIMVTLFSSQLNKLGLFIAASCVMVSMHTLSTLIGAFFAYLIPKNVISIVVIVLFFSFSMMMFYKGCCKRSEGEDGDD